VITFDEARARLIQIARPLESERIPLEEAAGRICAAPVVARTDAPSVALSAMDGYALRDQDLQNEGAALEVCGSSFAGDAPALRTLGPGQCMRIFTGAPMPPGADRVVMQEIVEREDRMIRLREAPGSTRHVRAPGSDFARGERILRTGARLTPPALVAAAAADHSHVRVWSQPRVAILATGDELVPPGSPDRRPGAIPESVSYGVAALAEAWGARVVMRRRVGDRLEDLAICAEEALEAADIVVAVGGASVGEKDFAQQMFAGSGLDLAFCKVAIKPGKPIWIGRSKGRIVVGLPGNPSAAMVTARLFLAPLVAGLGGRDPAVAWRWRTTPLASPLKAGGDRECFQRGRSGMEGVTPLADQDSSAQRALAEADLLIRRKPGARALPVGDLVEVLDL